MANIGWLKKVGQFIKTATNTLLGRPQIQGISTGVAREVTAQRLAPLASSLSDGSIGLTAWQTSMRSDIKNLYINQYMLGRGGREMMTKADWGRCGGLLKDQYRYLDGFAKDLSLMDVAEREKYIAARSQLYANASNEAYERGRAATAKELGYDTCHWWRTPAESCDTCITRSQINSSPIGPRGGWMDPDDGEVFPADGNSICLTNCKCYLTWSNSATGDEWDAAAPPTMASVEGLTQDQIGTIVDDLLVNVPPQHTQNLTVACGRDIVPSGYTYGPECFFNDEGAAIGGLYRRATQTAYVHPHLLREGGTLYHEIGHHVVPFQWGKNIPLKEIEAVMPTWPEKASYGLRNYSFTKTSEFTADCYRVYHSGTKPQWIKLRNLFEKVTGLNLEDAWGLPPKA